MFADGAAGVTALRLTRILRVGGILASIVDVSLGLQVGKFEIGNQENVLSGVQNLVDKGPFPIYFPDFTM